MICFKESKCVKPHTKPMPNIRPDTPHYTQHRAYNSLHVLLCAGVSVNISGRYLQVRDSRKKMMINKGKIIRVVVVSAYVRVCVSRFYLFGFSLYEKYRSSSGIQQLGFK